MGVTVVFRHKICEISFQGEKLMEVARVGKLYATVAEMANQVQSSQEVTSIEQEQEVELWHARLGHVATSRLESIGKACDDLPKQAAAPASTTSLCDGCMKGKTSVTKFPVSVRGNVKTTQGSLRFDFYQGLFYFVVIYFLKAKSEVLDYFKKYKAMMENQLDARVKYVRSDNGEQEV
ncbi:GAG-pre-integrase domain-containing protein [Phytophthora infestans]|uniref:GAG-pre-integrase domain-containing protein n=1 Tax=Phytophthora infestans TaxID=4787 RepID=A0A833RQH0_PHYIN|nr:GAG-pre-integrase domain-containing protein [Phytophthora infestans]